MKPISLAADLLNPLPAPVTAAAKAVIPDNIKKVAEDFEASFLSALMQPMFNSVGSDGPFGGGQGEQAFKSFMVDAIAKQTAKKGGVGLADAVTRELMRMQGLTTPPTAAPDVAAAAAKTEDKA